MKHSDCRKMKFSIKGFFSKCDQIPSFLRIWSHLLKKSSIENFIFCAGSDEGNVALSIFACFPSNRENNRTGSSFPKIHTPKQRQVASFYLELFPNCLVTFSNWNYHFVWCWYICFSVYCVFPHIDWDLRWTFLKEDF